MTNEVIVYLFRSSRAAHWWSCPWCLFIVLEHFVETSNSRATQTKKKIARWLVWLSTNANCWTSSSITTQTDHGHPYRTLCQQYLIDFILIRCASRCKDEEHIGNFRGQAYVTTGYFASDFTNPVYLSSSDSDPNQNIYGDAWRVFLCLFRAHVRQDKHFLALNTDGSHDICRS